MTFVRAKLLATGPTVLSDWYVTHSTSTKPGNYQDGMLKLLRLTPTICVGFAGQVDRCLESVREARGSFFSNSFQRGMDCLAAATTDGVCEFIVATLKPGGVFEIKGGNSQCSSSAWIGDHRAFEIYQRHALGAHESPLDERAKLHESFREVVRSASVEGVGIMTVAVLPGESGFEYAPSATVTAGFTPQLIPSHTWTPVHFGGAHDGGFAEIVMGAADDAAVGVYFPPGGFGLVSVPLRSQVTKTVRAQTQNEFVERVLANFGVELKPGIKMT